MKRRTFLTNVALGTAAGSLSQLGACTPDNKTSAKENELKTGEKEPWMETCSISQRVRSGIALGGIGTGSIELRKDGQFYNWTLMNNAPFGAGPVFEIPTYPGNHWEDSLLFFIVRYREEGKDTRLKLLQINNSLEQGSMESIEYYFPWMEAVSEIEYSGRFPFVNMKFRDPEMPFIIHLEAFSPFLPHDVKNSSLPGVYFNFTIESITENPVDVMLLGSLRNLVGYDVTDKYFTSEIIETENYKYFDMSVGGMDESHVSYGHMGLSSLSPDSSYYLGWEHRHPYYEKLLTERELENIDDTAGRNVLNKKTGHLEGRTASRTLDQRHFSSIAMSRKLQSGESAEHSFLLSWHFPNNPGSINEDVILSDCKPYSMGQKITKDEGHYYSNYFHNAAEVADYMAENKEILTRKSHKFVEDFFASDLETFILNQVNSHLNTFITSGRLTRKGVFAIREGMTSAHSWGPMATTDVSLYGSLPVLFLFPELQKSTMRAHKNVQTPKGEIAHGLGLDLSMTQNGTWGVYNRIDLPGQFVQLCLRDFFYTNDHEYLEEMWPAVKKAINYILEYRDDDGNQMPYIKGIECSYDNFPMFGMASYIQSQWLCAIASAIRAADILGDNEVKEKYEIILSRGSEMMDEKLWNGNYYRLYNDEGGKIKGDKSEGCLTDQIIGQWVAHLTGLGYLFKEEHVKSALKNILDLSYKKEFGLRNSTWPEYPERFPIEDTNLWVDQANTPWTGVELAFASFLIYEDFVSEGLEVIKTVDNRYRKARLYWDHQEFGGHYYRPMSAWGIINALLGLSINQDHILFNPKIKKDTYKVFFSPAGATCHYFKEGKSIGIRTLSGQLKSRKLTFKNHGLTEKELNVEIPDKNRKPNIKINKNEIILTFAKPLELNENEVIKIS